MAPKAFHIQVTNGCAYSCVKNKVDTRTENCTLVMVSLTCFCDVSKTHIQFVVRADSVLNVSTIPVPVTLSVFTVAAFIQ